MKDPNSIPEYIIDATPGARDARDRWRKEKVADAKLNAALVAAQRAYPPTRWIDSSQDARRGPAEDTTQAQLDAAQLAERDAKRAVHEQGRKTRRALEAFDALFDPDSPATSARKRAAAALSPCKRKRRPRGRLSSSHSMSVTRPRRRPALQSRRWGARPARSPHKSAKQFTRRRR